MLKIGEFSQLSQVTIKTLHHYDELGLLKPAYIDPSSGYRFYNLEQLPRIHSIMALKELDLSLEQIGLILVEDLSVDQIRAMFRLKEAQLKQNIDEQHRRMAMVKNRLLMLESEGNLPQLDVVIKKLEAMRVLSMRISPKHEMAKVVEEVQCLISTKAIHYAGKNLDVLYGGEINLEAPFDPINFHHEILLAVEDTQSGDVELDTQGKLLLRDMPAIDTAATLIFHGIERKERLILIMHLQRWAVTHGFRLQGLMRLLNHRGPLDTLDRKEWVSEIQLAVAEEN